MTILAIAGMGACSPDEDAQPQAAAATEAWGDLAVSQTKEQWIADREAHLRRETTIVPQDTAIVPDWQWVDVENGQKDATTCGIEFGGALTIKEEFPHGLLVTYAAPEIAVHGTMCPTGVEFVIDGASFAKMTSRYHDIVRSIRHDEALVREVLDRHEYGWETPSLTTRWVTAMNTDPVLRYWANGVTAIGHGEHCIIRQWESTRSRGTANNGRTLYEYVTPHQYYGTSCPAEVLFFD